MNTGGPQIEKKEVWQPMAEAINVCLQAYPAQSLLALVNKRYGRLRHKFHAAVYVALENNGVDVSMTFSMHLKPDKHFTYQSLDAPGRLGRVETRGAEAPAAADNFMFKTSKLLYGTMSDVTGTQEVGGERLEACMTKHRPLQRGAYF